MASPRSSSMSSARLDRLYGQPLPYMMWLNQRPTTADEGDEAWFNVEIVSPWRSAGVQRFIAAAEVASEEFFNPVVPEDVATQLRFRIREKILGDAARHRCVAAVGRSTELADPSSADARALPAGDGAAARWTATWRSSCSTRPTRCPPSAVPADAADSPRWPTVAVPGQLDRAGRRATCRTTPTCRCRSRAAAGIAGSATRPACTGASFTVLRRGGAAGGAARRRRRERARGLPERRVRRLRHRQPAAQRVRHHRALVAGRQPPGDRGGALQRAELRRGSGPVVDGRVCTAGVRRGPPAGAHRRRRVVRLRRSTWPMARRADGARPTVAFGGDAGRRVSACARGLETPAARGSAAPSVDGAAPVRRAVRVRRARVTRVVELPRVAAVDRRVARRATGSTSSCSRPTAHVADSRRTSSSGSATSRSATASCS